MDHARPLTRIIATIGPASATPQAIGRLIDAGAGAMRLNFSHGDEATHDAYYRAIRDAAEDRGEPVAIIGDLPGAKVRLGEVAGGSVDVPDGAVVRIEIGDRSGGGPPWVLGCPDPALAAQVRSGDRVLIDDGRIELRVTAAAPDALDATVVHGGPIGSRKGVNLPDNDPATPPLTPRDHQWVRWAVHRRLDFLALSYCGTADHVRQLQQVLRDAGSTIPVIAKIERPAAVAHAESIIEAAGAVMVARGDLGVEMDLAEVPVIQKRLTWAAARAGTPSIVATQMLQSMIEAAAPTRAEASDVAGAIFDRVDAVMLSGETAVGRYPDETVRTMARIARRAEAHLATLPPEPSPPVKLIETGYRTAALAHGAWTTAHDIRARAIVVWSQTGGGARYLSQNRFRIPIISVSSDREALRRMQLLRGVHPVHMEVPQGLEAWTRQVDGLLQGSFGLAPGDPCVLVAGHPLGTAGSTNRLAMHWIGRPDGGFAGG